MTTTTRGWGVFFHSDAEDPDAWHFARAYKTLRGAQAFASRGSGRTIHGWFARGGGASVLEAGLPAFVRIKSGSYDTTRFA